MSEATQSVGRVLDIEYHRAIDSARQTLALGGSTSADDTRAQASRLRWLAADLEQSTGLPGLAGPESLDRAREARSWADKLDQRADVLGQGRVVAETGATGWHCACGLSYAAGNATIAQAEWTKHAARCPDAKPRQ